MKTKILLLLSLITMAVAAVDIKFTWNANPSDQQVTSYSLYQSSVVTGPFAMVTNTVSTNVTLSLTPGRYFFYLTASNLWSESLPSNTVSTPASATAVTNIKLTR